MCYLAQFAGTSCEYRADGRADRAHLVPKQRLRQAGVSHVWDYRWWTYACRKHHHQLDNGFLKLHEQQYPRSFRDHAERHGLFFDNDRKTWLAGTRPAEGMNESDQEVHAVQGT